MKTCLNREIESKRLFQKAFVRFLKIYILFIGFSVGAFGQKINIEELKSELPNSNEEIELNVLLKTSRLYYDKFSLTDSAMVYANKAKVLADEMNDFDGVAKSIVLLEFGTDDFERSISTLEDLLGEEDRIEDKNIIGEIQLSLAFGNYILGDLKKALTHGHAAATVFSATKNYDKLTLAYTRIASIFTTQRLFDKCTIYQKMAFETLPKVENSFTKISFYSSMLGQYVQMGFYEPNYLDSAIINGEKGLLLAVADEYYSKGFQLSNTLSTAYRLKGEMTKSLEYLLYAKQFSSYLHSEEVIVLYFGLTDYYFDAKSYSLSLAYLDTVRDILVDSEDHAYKMAFYQRVYEYNKELQNYEEALEGLELFKNEEDSIFNIQNNEVILELNEKYQTDIKNAEIFSLQQKQKIDGLEIEKSEAQIKWLLGLILIAILIILIFVIIYRQRRIRSQLKLLEIEQRLNLARINPHFFFNAMASLQTFAYQEKSPQTSLFISRFAKIMRQSLENTYDEMITIETEIDFLSDYLKIQQLRFPEKFEFAFKIDPTLEIDELKIPGMLIQPFLENAIEHGFKNLGKLGLITISIDKKDDFLNVEVSDNGLGLKEKEADQTHISRATQITQDRLRLFNIQHKSTASYQQLSQKNQEGFEIVITLPLIY